MATAPTDTTIPSAFEPPVPRAEWTVADLLDQLGGIPPERVHSDPGPRYGDGKGRHRDG